MENSEFKELYIEDELNKDILRNTLTGNAKLTNQGDVLLEPNVKNTKKAIVIYLLGTKVLKIDGIKTEETERPTDISQKTGLPIGTVKPRLRELLEEGFVKQTDDGRYYIPNYMLLKVQELFKHKEG